MLIKSTVERVIMVPVADGAPLLRIMPKVNEIEDSVWNMLRPHLIEKIEPKDHKGKKAPAQIVELFVTTKQGAKGVSGKSFAELSEADAVSTVEDTLDKDLLLRWRDREKRPEVRLAIVKQLEELAKRNKPKKDDE